MLPVFKSPDISEYDKSEGSSDDCPKSVDVISTEGCIANAIEFSRRGHQEQTLGNHMEALRWMEQSLSIVENLLPDSPEVAVILSSIGLMYQQAGIDSGFKYQMRALMIRARDQPGTPYVAESHEYVGMSLLSEQRYEEALRHFSLSLAFHESKDPSSFIVAIHHLHIGQAHEGMGDARDAIISFEKALSIMLVLSPASLDIATVYVSLGRALHEVGSNDAAKTQLYRALEVYNAHLPSSLEISNVYVELGKVIAIEKDAHDQAQMFFEKALEIQHTLAPTSLDIANSYHQVAVLHISTGSCDLGRDFLLRAISIREKLAPVSLDLARSLFVMGNLLIEEGQYTQAYNLHLRALELRSKLQPLKTEEADSLHAMGVLSENACNWEAALGYFSREFLGRSKNQTAKVHNSIGNVMMRLPNRTADAIYNLRMAVKIQLKSDNDGFLGKYLSDLISALDEIRLVENDTIQKLKQLQQTTAPIPEELIDDVCKSLSTFF